jgi:hypothetical protein
MLFGRKTLHVLNMKAKSLERRGVQRMLQEKRDKTNSEPSSLTSSLSNSLFAGSSRMHLSLHVKTQRLNKS